MFTTFSLDDARDQLNTSIGARLREEWRKEHGFSFAPMQFPFERVRFPVGLFFIRGDRAGTGKELAETVVASFGYWNDDSGKYFDMVFPGWWKDGDAIGFDRKHFLDFNNELNEIIKCKKVFKGETDILLLNFDYLLSEQSGDFYFGETIHLPVEEMLRDGRITSLDALMYELTRQGELSWPRSDKEGVWEISDRLGFHKGRKALWEILKEKFLFKDAAKVYHDLRPYAVCDLRR